MTLFKYIAISHNGMKIRGNVEAENIREARHILYQRKISILSIKVRRATDNSMVMSFFKTVNSADLVLLTRQMSILVSSDIPLDETLKIIEKQSKKRYVSTVIHDVRKKVVEGYSLSDSLSYFPRVFNVLYRSMIAAGELSGHLGLVLSQLAEHIEQTQRLQRKIVQALIYPAILIFISAGVIIILLSVVIPNIIESFSFDNQELPLSTRAIMNISYYLKNNMLLIVIIAVALWIGLRRALKIKAVSYLFECYYLKIPVLGKAISRVNISRYLKTLTVLTSNGISLIPAMKISNQVITNYFIKEKLVNSTKLVGEGNSLSSSLSLSRVFSPMILHIISSGECSGKLDVMLKKVTSIQEEELVTQINIFITLLEPIVMIIMAVFIFIIVLAVFEPILQISSLTI
ncbi:type II secretion system F family protein [Yersinia bercovieri]|nr:type II secretion system F family protein [Yersinia bercovieri]MDN0103325.1 type II secretion system F family protein [Yersinia bercovieri]QKJ05799.1 type II secretion system F family protein [Yersinia bercovieri ATCC 43970]CNI72575.1 general protein secretion protein [Yersinia bercovieri]